MKEIENLEDIQLFVDEFYARIREDVLLAPIFNSRLDGKWEAHLNTMYRFWQTILLPEHTYNGYPFRPHAHLPVDARHFERWLSLFYETLDCHFVGQKVHIAKRQAQKMAELFQLRIQQIQMRSE